MRISIAVALTHLCVLTNVEVTVLKHSACRISATGTEVDCHHRLDSGLLTPSHKLVKTELIGLEALPSGLGANGTLLAGAYGILPSVSGNEVTAGISYGSNSLLLNKIDNVLTEAVFISGGVTGLIKTAVYKTTHMLGKGAVNSLVDVGAAEILIGV
jgi:hypothetical protein